MITYTIWHFNGRHLRVSETEPLAHDLTNWNSGRGLWWRWEENVNFATHFGSYREAGAMTDRLSLFRMTDILRHNGSLPAMTVPAGRGMNVADVAVPLTDEDTDRSEPDGKEPDTRTIPTAAIASYMRRNERGE